MKTRRDIGVGQKYNKHQCTCYVCVGDIIAYRDKKSLAEYEDSVLEYDLTKDEEHESILGVGLGSVLSTQR
jgi:hypothetical protein